MIGAGRQAKGRVGLYEVTEINDDITELILIDPYRPARV